MTKRIRLDADGIKKEIFRLSKLFGVPPPQLLISDSVEVIGYEPDEFRIVSPSNITVNVIKHEVAHYLVHLFYAVDQAEEKLCEVMENANFE